MMLQWKMAFYWPHAFAIPCPFPMPPASDDTPSPSPTDVSEGLTVPNCLPAGYKNTSRQSVVTNTPAKQISLTQQLQCSTPTHLALPTVFSLSVTHQNDSRTSWQTDSVLLSTQTDAQHWWFSWLSESLLVCDLLAVSPRSLCIFF